MGIKSTVELTRAHAITRALTLKARVKEEKWRKKFEAMSNGELEIALESLSDEAAGGEGFDNFCVYDDPSYL